MTKLEQLKAAYAATTPGPWVFDGDGLMGPESDEEQNFVCTFEDHPEFALTEQDYKNAEFIALARAHMSSLLEAVDLLEPLASYASDATLEGDPLPSSVGRAYELLRLLAE